MKDENIAHWQFDIEQCSENIEYIIGVDEAGRGSLAGDMYAAAVVLTRKHRLVGISDSKLLRPKQREVLAGQIRENALSWGIAVATHREIDERGLDWANRVVLTRAVRAAVRNLPCCRSNTLLLVDGVRPPYRSPFAYRLVKGGDRLSLAIGAASILAKTERDRYCVDVLDKRYPAYGFGKHKGYGTEAHFAAIERYGPAPVHRVSFRLQRSS